MSKARLVITAIEVEGRTHYWVRHDKIDKAGCVTLRVNGRLHHIGVGRTLNRPPTSCCSFRTWHIRVVHAITGELLRDLILRSSQGLPTHRPTTRSSPQMTDARTDNSWVRASAMT